MTYNPALDGLRALAVLTVLAFHCRVPGFAGGFVGVDLFFVLSGFLITGLLAAERERAGRIDLRRFYLRRFLRLMPPLALMLAAYVLIAPRVWPQVPESAHIRDALLASLYLTDYTRALAHVPFVLHHTWSLSVEEHFYLVWPFAVIWLFARPRLALLAGAYAMATAWRAANVLFSDEWNLVYYRFDTHLSGLLLGGLIAFLLADKTRAPSPRQADATALCALGLLAACIGALEWNRRDALLIGLTVAEAASALAIVAATTPGSIAHRALSWPPLTSIGLVSYSIYLWHYPIAAALRDSLEWEMTLAIVLPASLAVALASWVWVERPLRHWRRERMRALAAAAP